MHNKTNNSNQIAILHCFRSHTLMEYICHISQWTHILNTCTKWKVHFFFHSKSITQLSACLPPSTGNAQLRHYFRKEPLTIIKDFKDEWFELVRDAAYIRCCRHIKEFLRTEVSLSITLLSVIKIVVAFYFILFYFFYRRPPFAYKVKRKKKKKNAFNKHARVFTPQLIDNKPVKTHINKHYHQWLKSYLSWTGTSFLILINRLPSF